jgi:ribose-phosphate pyrophosphokinase
MSSQPPRGPAIDPREVRLFSGSSNEPLAAAIANHLAVPLEPTRIRRFSNDNLYIQLGATVRSRSVFVVQSLSPPVNDHLVELLMMLDIARAAAAREVHAVIPYYSFARSDKKDAPRISITARLVADLLRTAGASQVMTMMLHSPQVHGFFSVPADPLTARPVLLEHFRDQNLEGTVVVAPDVGSAKSAARFADLLGLPVAAANKQRVADNKVCITGLVGQQVRGFSRALVFDDEIATGSSVVEITRVLAESGIASVDVVCTHGVFVAGAIDRLTAIDVIKNIVVTDTVHIPESSRTSKLVVLSVAPVFAEAIERNWRRESIGSLFAYGDED